MKQAVAIDVGGTSVKSGVVSDEGKVLGKVQHTPIDSRGDAESILGTFAEILKKHLDEAENCAGIGFGFPSPFDYPKGICLIHGLEKYEAIYEMNIGDELRKRVEVGELPIRFRNDAEAAIIGEYFYGVGQPYNRVIGVTLGTGCGSSFIVDGVRVEEGAGVPDGGFLFPEMYKGVRIDDYFSKRGLEKMLLEAGITPEIPRAAEFARSGNENTKKVFKQFGRDLGACLEPYVRPFEAEAVLVLGGISATFDLFSVPMNDELSVVALQGSIPREAPLLGAAQLVL